MLRTYNEEVQPTGKMSDDVCVCRVNIAIAGNLEKVLNLRIMKLCKL